MAETLVTSIGSQLGKPLMIRDFDFGPQPYMEMKANVRMMDAAQSADEPIAFRKIKLQAQITAQFEIK